MSVQPYSETKDDAPSGALVEGAGEQTTAPLMGDYRPTEGYQSRGGPNGYLMGPPQASEELRTKSILALVLGLASFFCGIVTSIPAVIIGHIALKEIRAQGLKDDPSYGMALAGTIVGWIMNAVSALLILFFVFVMILLTVGGVDTMPA